MLCVDAALSHFLSYSAPHSSTPSLACFCTRKNKYAFTPRGSLSLRVSYPCCRGSAPGAGITSPEPQRRLRASRARIHPNPHLASLFFFFPPTPNCPFLKGLQTKYSSSYTPAPRGRLLWHYSALTGTIQPWERRLQATYGLVSTPEPPQLSSVSLHLRVTLNRSPCTLPGLG